MAWSAVPDGTGKDRLCRTAMLYLEQSEVAPSTRWSRPAPASRANPPAAVYVRAVSAGAGHVCDWILACPLLHLSVGLGLEHGCLGRPGASGGFGTAVRIFVQLCGGGVVEGFDQRCVLEVRSMLLQVCIPQADPDSHQFAVHPHMLLGTLQSFLSSHACTWARRKWSLPHLAPRTVSHVLGAGAGGPCGEVWP